MLTLSEEHVLLRYCASSLLRICRSLQSPRAVRSTATAYLWRAYLCWSPLQRDPRAALLACIYLASKAEEAYVSAAELSRLSGTSPDAILRGEVALLAALRYDLAVHGPFRPAAGFLEDDDLAPFLDQVLARETERHEQGRAARGPGEDAGGRGGSDDQSARQPDPHGSERAPPTAASVAAALMRDAEAACDALLLTDAPMLHAPGRLGLAAVRSAFAKRGVRLDGYLEAVVAKANRTQSAHGDAHRAQENRSQTSPALSEETARLAASLAEIDALAAAASRAAAQDEQTVSAIDAKLRSCREAARAPAGGTGDPARAKEERKAKERAARRAAAEAAVGVSDL